MKKVIDTYIDVETLHEPADGHARCVVVLLAEQSTERLDYGIDRW